MVGSEYTGRPLLLATLAILVVSTWQWITVHANYAGNWTALFCTGELLGAPASLASEHIWLFPNTNGYDGQMYHYVAHDPLIRDPSLKNRVDDPRLRYRRILVPALVYVLAWGRSERVDPTYYCLILIFVGLGTFWTAAYCQRMGRSPVWGLLFLLLPATLVSIDRMVIDVALAALAAGFAYHVRSPSWRLFVILSAALLTRETGVLLLGGYCGFLILQRRFSEAARYSLAALPAALWYVYVHLQTARADYRATLIPLSGILSAVIHPAVYPPGVWWAWVARLGDYLALAGVLAAFLLAVRWHLHRKFEVLSLSILSFAAMGIFLQRTDHWLHVYDFGRVYTPLLLFLGLDGLRRKSWAAVTPLLCMLPRIGMQFGHQILGVISHL